MPPIGSIDRASMLVDTHCHLDLAYFSEGPDAVIACVGGGSNAMGLFHRFREDAGVRLIGVEAGSRTRAGTLSQAMVS